MGRYREFPSLGFTAARSKMGDQISLLSTYVQRLEAEEPASERGRVIQEIIVSVRRAVALCGYLDEEDILTSYELPAATDPRAEFMVGSFNPEREPLVLDLDSEETRGVKASYRLDVSDMSYLGRVIEIEPTIVDICGYAPDRFLEDPHVWFELIHPDDRIPTVEVVDLSIRTGRAAILRCRLRTIAGRYRLVEESVWPRKRNGDVTELFGTIRPALV